MSAPIKLIIAVVGSLLAYAIAAIFLTSIITGTTAADNMLQDLLPIVIAGGGLITTVVIAFKGEG